MECTELQLGMMSRATLYLRGEYHPLLTLYGGGVAEDQSYFTANRCGHGRYDAMVMGSPPVLSNGI
jgi:hypothetical protein